MLAWGKIAQKLRVPVGTVLGLIFLLLMHPSLPSLWGGAVVALMGAALRIWAAGHIDKGKVLAQSGPYAFTRNPLYLGSFLMATGIVVAGNAYWLLIPFGVFFLGVYYPVMKAEEIELLQGYAQEFVRYASRVPLFIPTFRGNMGPRSTFRWSRVMRNREHHTFAGLLITVAVLMIIGMLRAGIV